jgi:type IV secretory pathway VirB2 component (pilin)
VGRNVAVALYVIAMIIVIVGVDVLFFRHQFWPRLAVNVGIVLVFGACYWRFLKH